MDLSNKNISEAGFNDISNKTKHKKSNILSIFFYTFIFQKKSKDVIKTLE